ncbi:hypothetical protein [Streptomyces sp. NPDC002088]|uniref:hypothetical protein n=1 Tax=Streptomyces sp. NPDC002088 TaxID=3154665 RepID=UPI00332C035B
MGDEARLELLDDGWVSVRAAWARLATTGKILADEMAAAVERTAGRAARLKALPELPSDASYHAARSAVAQTLSRLAADYQQYSTDGKS